MSIVLWGASGQAIVLHELFSHEGRHVVALFDNDSLRTSPLEDVPIFTGMDGFSRWLDDHDPSQYGGLAAIGGNRGEDRLQIHGLFERSGIRVVTAIHPRAFVAATAFVGPGSQVMAQSAVCARANIGRAVIINTGAIVEHECVLEDGVHIGPGATLAGCVSVGRNAFVGAGATILPRVKIGANSVVGAGAVVTKDVLPETVVRGVPARRS
jgi:sugar O-acyltransferase (sialic acid O-acetyltransferase NeuD family)